MRWIPLLLGIMVLGAATATFGDVAYSPASGTKDVCPDMPLVISFSSAPALGEGTIQILDAADNTVVESIDTTKPTRTHVIGGVPNFNFYPIIITGNDAAIYPDQSLQYGKTYIVKISTGAFGGKEASGDWKFTTRAKPPEAKNRIIVAPDGSGDFASVQGAIDSVPAENKKPITIFIKDGTYHEIICFINKDEITLQGEDREKAIIAYSNNDKFNSNANGNPFAATAPAPGAANPRTGAVYRRGMFLAHHCNDLTIENLTLHNTTPVGGSQAEAIILNGSTTARATIEHVDMYSYQDTLQINGQAYLKDCHIEGDVDYMWGRGPCFFQDCTCVSLRSGAYYTQIRNPASNHGFVYKDCTFEGSPDVKGNFLARIAPARFPASEVVLIDCVETPAVGAVAWKLDGGTEAPDVHFWEFNSHDSKGAPVDVSARLNVSKQLQLPDDKEAIDHYSDPKWVLGGWAPADATN